MLDNYQAPIGDQVASARVSAAGVFEGEHVGFLSVGLVGNLFTLILSPKREIARLDATIKISCANGASVQFQHDHTGPTTILVRGFTGAAVANNSPFYIEVDRKAVG